MLLSGTALTKTSGRVTEEESVTPQQISALEGKVAQCEAQLALCRATKRNSELAVKDGCNRLKAIEIELEKLTISLSRLQEQEGELTTRLNDLNKGTALSPAEKKEMAALEARILNLGNVMVFLRVIVTGLGSGSG
jgi:predicted transcriptional regulator